MAHTAIVAETPRYDASEFLGSIVSRLKRRFLGAPLDPPSATLIAQLIAYAAEAERLVAEQERRINALEELSTTDELTGLLNKRGFQKALEHSISAARRHGDAGALAFIDVNGLKQINDHLGHAAGDAALVSVSRVLVESIRTTDAAARLHGDEFVVLFCRSDPGHSEEVLERLRAALAHVPVTFGRRQFTVSASVGSTSYGAESDAGMILEAADASMYGVKRRRSTKAAARMLRR